MAHRYDSRAQMKTKKFQQKKRRGKIFMIILTHLLFFIVVTANLSVNKMRLLADNKKNFIINYSDFYSTESSLSPSPSEEMPLVMCLVFFISSLYLHSSKYTCGY